MTASRDAAIRAEAAGRIEFIEPACTDVSAVQSDGGTDSHLQPQVSPRRHRASDLGYHSPSDTTPNDIDGTTEVEDA